MKKTFWIPLVAGATVVLIFGIYKIWYTGSSLQNFIKQKGHAMPYTLPPLLYAYNALEPYIDARTMEIHHTKHQQGYINKLNAALKKHPEFQDVPLKQLMANIDSLPDDIRISVRHNGGGTLNHAFFFDGMSPQKSEPHGKLREALVCDFGSFEAFKEKLSDVARSHFASGWVWLAKDKDGKLFVYATPAHDSPWMSGQEPILCLDVWEHAYYLLYQNRRPDYVDQWWHVVDWNRAEKLYTQV